MTSAAVRRVPESIRGLSVGQHDVLLLAGLLADTEPSFTIDLEAVLPARRPTTASDAGGLA